MTTNTTNTAGLADEQEDGYQGDMASRNKAPPTQTSMFDVFEAAAFERDTAHMPSAMEAAIPYFRDLLERFNAAVLQGDGDGVERIEKEAEDLAVRLNGGTRFGIKAEDDSPCNVLERETAAAAGITPIWGQVGEIVVEVKGCRVLAEMDGIYGIGFPAFAAKALDWEKPFISETGYRSFLGYARRFVGGVSVEEFVRMTVEDYVDGELKGRLVGIEKAYRERGQAELDGETLRPE